MLHRVGDDLLIRHGDAETWMDAVGADGPFSPRGDRAVEIQVLWREALLAGARLAEIAAAGSRSKTSGSRVGDEPAGSDDRAERWRGIAGKVTRSLASTFWDHDREALYDRIMADGTPDGRDRPNQVFALSLPGYEPASQGDGALADPIGGELLTAQQREAVLERLLATCVLPHGVASLSPDDPEFHPVHLDLDRYHFDEAYHNGDVWVWLTGPIVTALIRAGRISEAWEQTRVLRDLIFNEGAAGTLPELRNGRAPQKGENVAGAVSQAWSLAEFVRNFHQDYLGLRPDLPAGRLELAPALPPDLSWVSCPVTLGGGTASLFFRTNADGPGGVYRIAAADDLPELTVRFTAMVPPGTANQRPAGAVETVLAPGTALEFTVEPDGDGWRTTVSTI